MSDKRRISPEERAALLTEAATLLAEILRALADEAVTADEVRAIAARLAALRTSWRAAWRSPE